MASLKPEKPQGSFPAATGPPKIQQAKPAGTKPAPKVAPAPKKVVQKPQEPKKVAAPKATPQAK